MMVGELIGLLKEYPPELPVHFENNPCPIEREIDGAFTRPVFDGGPPNKLVLAGTDYWQDHMGWGEWSHAEMLEMKREDAERKAEELRSFEQLAEWELAVIADLRRYQEVRDGSDG